MPLARIVAVRTDLPNQIGERMTVDVGIDREGYFSQKGITFGFFGEGGENPKIVWIFILRQDGRISYSHDSENHDDTNHGLNLVGKKIELNELFTLTWDEGEEFTYRIERIVNLSEAYQ